jgi:thioredoxin-like negative regulator of GroEL
MAETTQTTKMIQASKLNDSILLGLLCLLLVIMILCKHRQQSVSELFGLSGLNYFSNKKEKLTGGSKNNFKVLFFHADWCGHCQSFKPEWSKFESWCDSNNVKYQSLEGDKEPELSKKYKIQGFPTVLKVTLSGDLIEEYNGARTAASLQEFTLKPFEVAKKSSGNSTGNKILFFHADWCGHCQSFKPEWTKFESWCDSHNVQYKSLEGDKHSELSQKYKIEGYPTVLKVDASGELIEEFRGSRTCSDLEQFASN